MKWKNPSTESISKIPKLALVIWIFAAMFFLYEFYLRTVLASLVPELLGALHISTEQLSFIDVAYCVAYGVMQIPVGILIDKYGVKRSLLVGICACGTGVALFSAANGFFLAFCSRILMGFGSSFAFVSLLIITINTLPKRLHGRFFGFSQLIGAIGPLIAGAPLIILLHLTHDNWRILLIFSSLFGFGLAAILYLLFKKRPPIRLKQLRATRTGFVKITAIMKNKQIYPLLLYSGTIYLSLALLGTLWGTTYLKTRGITATHAGLLTSILWIGLGLGSLLLGYLTDKTGRPKLIMRSSAILGLIASLFVIFTSSHNELLLLILMLGLGIASAGQCIAFLVLARKVNSDLKATALGINNAVISFAIAAGIPTITLLIHHPAASHFTQTDFSSALLIMPLLYLLATVFTFTPRSS